MRKSRGILVTGGGAFLGDNIAAALLAAGSEVTLLARPGAEDKLAAMDQRVRWSTADVWSPASLRGKARNHAAVIHTVGSLIADPSRGLTYERLNFVSARNVANMCVSDGVPRMILLSGVNAPWVSRAYIRSKRKAERFLDRAGLTSQIIRAPLVYAPGEKRPLFFRCLSLIGNLPPFAWFYPGRAAPMPAHVFARGVAHIALHETESARVYYARDLRRLARQASQIAAAPAPIGDDRAAAAADGAFDTLDEDLPFGWSPSDRCA